MCDEDNDSEYTELTDCSGSRDSDDAENAVVTQHFESIRRSRVAETLCYSLFDRQGDRCPPNSVNLCMTS